MPTEERKNALENEYFHKQEKILIEKMKSKLAGENASQSDLNCPKCDGKLAETDFEDIKIDVCNKCNGVWLDPGELARITEKEDGKSGWFGRLFE